MTFRLAEAASDHLTEVTFVQGYLEAGFQCKNLMAHGSPVLFYVMQNCSIEMFTMLLDAGASPELPNEQGQTAILAAIQSRKENAINVCHPRLKASKLASLTPF